MTTNEAFTLFRTGASNLYEACSILAEDKRPEVQAARVEFSKTAGKMDLAALAIENAATPNLPDLIRLAAQLVRDTAESAADQNAAAERLEAAADALTREPLSDVALEVGAIFDKIRVR